MLFLKNSLFVGFVALASSLLSSCVTSSDFAEIAVSESYEEISANFKGRSREDIGQTRLDQMLYHECNRSYFGDDNNYHTVKPRYPVVELLIKKGASATLAASSCDVEADLKYVKFLDEKGADWNATGKVGDREMKPVLLQACGSYNAESLAYIRSKGAIFDNNKKVLFMISANCFNRALNSLNTPAIEYLISIGFDPNQKWGKKDNHFYPIHTLAGTLAYRNKNLNHPSMKALLNGGANPNVKDQNGHTPTDLYNTGRRTAAKDKIAKANKQRRDAQIAARQEQQDEQDQAALFQGLLAGAQEYNRIQGQKNSTGVKSYGDGVTPSKVLYGQNQRLPGTSNQKLQKSSGFTGQVNHTCRSGTKVNIPVAAKTSACLKAKKFMAITYGCNRIDDFQTLKSRCTQACGRQDCAETGG